MKEYKLCVTWSLCGTVKIKANSLEEAMAKFNHSNEHIPLPSDGEYIDGSFELSTNNVDEMKAMTEREELDTVYGCFVSLHLDTGYRFYISEIPIISMNDDVITLQFDVMVSTGFSTNQFGEIWELDKEYIVGKDKTVFYTLNKQKALDYIANKKEHLAKTIQKMQKALESAQ